MVKNFQVIKSILSESWLLSPDTARDLSFMVRGVLNPESISFEPLSQEDLAKASYVSPVTNQASGKVRNVGVVNLVGVLYKYDTCCSLGMESYGKMIRSHEQDPAVDAIVLVIDSPGGTVVGTNELAQTIRSCTKPVVGFVSDQACSGAYWLASCCREIYANNATASVGSIGVMCSFQDLSAYYEKQGIRNVTINAPQSKDKNQETRDLEAGNYAQTEERLGVLAETFLSAVRENRPGVRDDQLTGKVYFSQDVVGSLVDAIGTYEQALDRAATLVTDTANQHDNYMAKTLYPSLAAAAGVETFESADGSIYLSAEMAQSLESALALAATTQQEVVLLQESLTASQASKAESDTQVAALEARISALEAQPGAVPATVAPLTDGHATAEPKSDTFADALSEAKKFV